MELYRVTDNVFCQYGRVLQIETDALIAAAEKIPMPAEGSAYEAGVSALEALPAKEALQNEVFGEQEIQIGYCFGRNDTLNALEWHKSSEVNIAVTDMILFLGNLCEMRDGMYHSDRVKAFLVKKGEAIELYATTLHFCPCHTAPNGFGCIVVLPRGTNLPLEHTPKDNYLFRKNKWIVAHIENTALIGRGVAPGIEGKNYKVGVDI